MTVHQKGFEYKTIQLRKWNETQRSLIKENWELVSVDNGLVYLKRWWNEGEWDGLPPDSGMW